MLVPLEATTARAKARIGTVLKKKWHLDEILGVGGMAAVYAATHRNNKRAAIKMLHAELSQDAAIRKRFLREGYVANSIDQRGAVAVDYDDVSEDGLAFLVMELLEGETIEQRWLRKGRSLSPTEALSIADQLLDTLAAAHAQGIVHRDLKPGNIFLTKEGVVKILDFGIARVRELSSPLSTTLAGSAMGTPAFMAPEQARGRWEDVDGRTDLWAVGATLYTLVTGRFVHAGATASETLALAATRPVRSLAERRSDLHPSLISFVDRALSYDKAARFADAETMQQALRVTFATMTGRALSDSRRLEPPERPSVPTTRAITLRNIRPPDFHERTPAKGFWSSEGRSLWVACAAALALLLGVGAWAISRTGSAGDGFTTRAAAASGSLVAVSARAPVGSRKPEPGAAPEPSAVRVDDLPQETQVLPSHKKASARPAPSPSH